MKGEQVIAGLRCSEVLSVLSDYLDGALPADARVRVEGHVRGCEGCSRFGGRFAGVVRSLREELVREEPSSEIRARLAERLGR